MANITLSADPALIDKARALARRQGTTLNQLVRAYLKSITGDGDDASKSGRELLELMRRSGGRSGGKKLNRQDAYEGRL